MAAVATFAFVGIAVWTLVSFVAAVVIGHVLRRVETVPVRTSSRRIVDLRQSH